MNEGKVYPNQLVAILTKDIKGKTYIYFDAYSC